jgi:Transposase, Mutator family
MDGLAEWQSRPLDSVYAVIFIDAINVKIREGQVANRPVYLALGVTVDGERDVLGLWAGEHGDGEGGKYWLRVCRKSRTAGSGTCACWSATGSQEQLVGTKCRVIRWFSGRASRLRTSACFWVERFSQTACNSVAG